MPESPITASMIYPACEIELNAMKRLSSVWRMAKRLAMVILNTMTMPRRYCHCSNNTPKTCIRIEQSAKAAAPLDTTER